jgi:hypothetical protein
VSPASRETRGQFSGQGGPNLANELLWMRFQHRPGESEHSPSREDQRILPPPIGLDEVTVDLMNPAVDLQSQPEAPESVVEVTETVLHDCRLIAPPTRHACRAEQAMGPTLRRRPGLVA